MKANITILFLLIAIFVSCNRSGNQNKTLPATGNQKEIILVIEDKLWEGKKGEILREIFEKEIAGLPQSEKLFNLIQLNPKEFTRFFQTHKNIMIVSSDVKDSYSENKWANGQTVFYLHSDSKEIDFINSCNKTCSFLNRKELEEIKNSYEEGHNKDARSDIKEQFGFELFLPTEYTVLLKKEGLFTSYFHSYNEKQDLQKWIVVYEFQPTNWDLQEEIITRTDSVLKQYVEGFVKASYIQIDSRFSLIEDNGIYRGLWKMKQGAIMGGPIILRTRNIDDKVVVSLGIVFNPNENKRDFVRTFEAIL
ncbi:MAG: DUF4837 family protein [Flavobacteriales bacterium]|nr:DUF4837 family protein [Flavobacteriales bacterium]